MTNGWDKASVALDSLVAYNTMGRRGAMAAGTATATAGPGILVKLLDVAVRIYRESGGGLQDEIAIMQGLFADMTLKGASLKSTEQCKIVALMKAMTPSKKIVFRVALSLMEPEVTKVVVSGKSEKVDGKNTTGPSTEKFEKTGVDLRINTLKGIAALIDDDLGNVQEVVKMLDDIGALGSNNKALQAFEWGKKRLEQQLIKELGIEKLEDITYKMVETKLFGPEDPAERPVVYTLNPIKLFVNICTPGPTVKVILGSKPKAPRDAAPIRRSRR